MLTYATGDVMDRHLDRWQRLMAPIMTGTVIVAAIFFAVVTVVQFRAVQERANQVPQFQDQLVLSEIARPTTFAEQLALANASARFQMEREVVARRYGGAALAFSTGLWTRFMGFMTGMLLAFVGAVFVLGKLDAKENELAAGAEGISLSLKSSSPGLILAVLGTFLMALSILIQANAKTYEGAIYLNAPSSAADAGGAEPMATEMMTDDTVNEYPEEPMPRATSYQGHNMPGSPAEEHLAATNN